MKSAGPAHSRLTLALLKQHPLPKTADSGDKEDRGSVLVVGGSDRIPGAAILAGLAALRVGCGKLAIATPHAVAALVAQRLPESLVLGIDPAAARLSAAFRSLIDSAAAILVGVGMEPTPQTARLAAQIATHSTAPLVLDAGALAFPKRAASSQNRAPRHAIARPARCVLTPHAGEMASLSGRAKAAVQRNALRIAVEQQRRFGVTVVLKGATTYICDGAGVLCHANGHPGLGTSGSGDVLAGTIAGLSARGMTPRWAAAWGTYLHGRAGRALAARIGPVGFLAGEIADQLPAVLVASGQR